MIVVVVVVLVMRVLLLFVGVYIINDDFFKNFLMDIFCNEIIEYIILVNCYCRFEGRWFVVKRGIEDWF